MAISLAANACSDANGPESRTVAFLKVATGDKQTASAGTALATPVTFHAVDADGRDVANVIVAFSVAAGGGSVRAERDTSDGSGNVTADWTVGTAAGSAQLLTATVVSSSVTIAPAQATANVVAGAASALGASAATVSATMGSVLAPITATIRDKYGNATTATNVRITTRLENATGTTLGGTTEARTDGSGSASFTNLVTTGKAGAIVLLLESDGLTSARVNLTLAGGQPARVTTVGSATFDAEASLAGPPISARVLDTWDNNVAGVDVTFAIDASLVGHATSGADGIATLSTWIVPTIGTYKINATAGGATTGAQFTLNARAVSAKVLTPVAANPTDGFVGQGVTLAVIATDAAGHVVPNAPLTWTFGGTDQQVSTDGNGVATFTVQLPTKAGANQIVVRASATVSVTLSVRGLPNAVATVVAEKDSLDAPAGSTVTLTFIAKDAFGNSVPGVIVQGSALLSSTSMTPSSVTTDADGAARFSAVLDGFAGPQTFFAGLGFNAKTIVYATADRGTVRIARSTPCAYTLPATTLTTVDAFVYGTNGRAVPGIGVTWTVTVPNGQVSRIGPPAPAQTVVVQSGSDGYAGVVWFVPSVTGAYTLTGTGPQGYDLPATVSLTCTVS